MGGQCFGIEINWVVWLNSFIAYYEVPVTNNRFWSMGKKREWTPQLCVDDAL